MYRPAYEAAAELDRLLRALLAFRAGDGSHLPGYAEPILLFLGTRSHGAAGMRELREGLGLGQSRTSRLCAALARSGLVEVVTPSEDRRVSRVKLTARGFRLIGRTADAFRARRRSSS